MSLISQAAKRLEELRRSGVEVPRGGPDLLRGDVRRSGEFNGSGLASPAKPAVATNDAGPTQSDDDREARHAEVSLARLADAGLIVPDQPPTQLTQEFRAIKRPLIANAFSSEATAQMRANVVLVTSAIPGEGKSFCALNLALSIAAEVDKSVLLVDADVLRPSCASRLGIENDDGLLDLLEGDGHTASKYVYGTSIPRFQFLPSGRPRGSSAELLTSSRMERLLDDLSCARSDRMVVIDGPPLLPTTEARSLAMLAGQVVVVVEAGSTASALVQEAFRAVETCDVVLAVLNKQTSAMGYPAGSYRYGY